MALGKYNSLNKGLVLRAYAEAPLSHEEMDGNFIASRARDFYVKSNIDNNYTPVITAFPVPSWATNVRVTIDISSKNGAEDGVEFDIDASGNANVLGGNMELFVVQKTGNFVEVKYQADSGVDDEICGFVNVFPYAAPESSET